jgi:LCP family protein required for cell wall assembly
MGWRRNREERPPRVGAAVLVKASVAAVLIVLCSGGAVGAAIFFQVHKHINPPALPGLPKPEPAIQGVKVEPVAPNGPRTILVLGSDRRSTKSSDAKLGDVAPRSDTILLLRLDPKHNRIAVLSIPRDLDVTIPGFGENKINQAYDDGGAAKTTDTVKGLFETANPGDKFPINSVIDVNFKGFQKVVNYVGGVYIDVDRRYYIAPNTGTSAIDLQPGYQKLTGSEALAYVRFRHFDSDIFRAARQQDFVRQAARQPAVQKLKSLSQATRLLQIMQSYVRFDKEFRSFRNISGLAKSAFYLSTHNAPVIQVPFAGWTESADPATDTRLYISPANLHAIYTAFMNGKAPAGLAAGATKTKHTTKKPSKKAKGKTHKAPVAVAAGLVDAGSLGQDLAVLADPKLAFPFYYPEYRTTPSRYVDGTPRLYKLEDSKGKRHEAYRVVIDEGADGEFYGVQGTTWMTPPILANPDKVVERNGRKLLLFYDGSHLRLVGWKSPHAVYWVTNTLGRKVNNSQMLAIAGSLRRLKQ